MTGIAKNARTRLRTSRPSMSGSPRSRTMRSGVPLDRDDDRVLARTDVEDVEIATAHHRAQGSDATRSSLTSKIVVTRRGPPAETYTRTWPRRRVCPRSERNRRPRQRGRGRSRARVRCRCDQVGCPRSGTPRRCGSRFLRIARTVIGHDQLDLVDTVGHVECIRADQDFGSWGSEAQDAFSNRLSRICSAIVTSSETGGRSSSTSRRHGVRVRSVGAGAPRVARGRRCRHVPAPLRVHRRGCGSAPTCCARVAPGVRPRPRSSRAARAVLRARYRDHDDKSVPTAAFTTVNGVRRL